MQENGLILLRVAASFQNSDVEELGFLESRFYAFLFEFIPCGN